jgi:hypothetical protein
MSLIVVPIISVSLSLVFIYFDSSVRDLVANISKTTKSVIRQSMPTNVVNEKQLGVRSTHNFMCIFKHCEH